MQNVTVVGQGIMGVISQKGDFASPCVVYKSSAGSCLWGKNLELLAINQFVKMWGQMEAGSWEGLIHLNFAPSVCGMEHSPVATDFGCHERAIWFVTAASFCIGVWKIQVGRSASSAKVTYPAFSYSAPHLQWVVVAEVPFAIPPQAAKGQPRVERLSRHLHFLGRDMEWHLGVQEGNLSLSKLQSVVALRDELALKFLQWRWPDKPCYTVCWWKKAHNTSWWN